MIAYRGLSIFVKVVISPGLHATRVVPDAGRAEPRSSSRATRVPHKTDSLGH
jgi:hypothetical protein